MKSYQMIETAKDNFYALTGIETSWEFKNAGSNDGKVKFNDTRFDQPFVFELKNEVRNHHLQQLKDLKQSLEKPLLVIANTIYPPSKEYLKNNGINYLETSGNTFLNYKDVFLFIEGQKNEDRTHPLMVNRAFTKTGLKVVFVLLRSPAALRYPNRTLANLANVSLGAVNMALNGLITKGFLYKSGERGYKFSFKDALIENWVSAYQEKLKPDLHLGNFRLKEQGRLQNWQHLELDEKSYWGGEPGAFKLRKSLNPALLIIYTEDTRTDFMKKYRLIPDPEGEIMLYQKFWSDEMARDYNPVVPPLLIYADLMDTRDQRCIEEAQNIYKEYVEN